jgi:hypothetical protein
LLYNTISHTSLYQEKREKEKTKAEVEKTSTAAKRNSERFKIQSN